MKWLISKIMPSNEKIASKAVAEITKGVNGCTADKQAVVAKYATLANECAAIGMTLSDILKDGRIDQLEEEELVALVMPLIVKGREIVGV